MAGAILKALASVIMDLPLRSLVCWELMGFTDQVAQEGLCQQAGQT